jgi:hypothetical protein
MLNSRFSEIQILRILKDVDAGRSISELCSENAISSTEVSTFDWH